MDEYAFLPDAEIFDQGDISQQFLTLGINSFRKACLYVHNMPYGYNSDYNDILIIFKENQGSCTMKHAVIATLADELQIPMYKYVGIYKFTEEITTGAQKITSKYRIPYIPMTHCFLGFEKFRFDLTEGNNNGKKTSIESFIHSERVIPNISRNDEYRLYKRVLREKILNTSEMKNIEELTILKAREEAIKLLKMAIM